MQLKKKKKKKKKKAASASVMVASCKHKEEDGCIGNVLGRKERIEELKKQKKARLKGMEREIKTSKILDEGKMIVSFTRAELTTILIWHGVATPGDGKVPKRREKRRRILEMGKAALSYEDWTIEEEASLVELEANPILIKKTVLSHLKEWHKGMVKALPPEEKAAMMTEMTVETVKEDKEEEGSEEAYVENSYQF